MIHKHPGIGTADALEVLRTIESRHAVVLNQLGEEALEKSPGLFYSRRSKGACENVRKRLCVDKEN